MSKNRKRVLCTSLLVILCSMFLTRTTLHGEVEQPTRTALEPTGLAYYDEYFIETTYEDPESTASGWGTGALSMEREYDIELLDFYEDDKEVYDIEVQGHKAYITCYSETDSSDTLKILDLNVTSDLKLLGARNDSTGLATLAVNGNLLFTGTIHGSYRINCYNVSNPANFGDATGILLDYIDVDGPVTDIKVSGHLVFCAVYSSTSRNGLVIIDARDPTNLIELPNDWFSPDTHGVAVQGSYCYLAEGFAGFSIINYTQRGSIVELGSVDFSGIALDVVVDGKYAYVANSVWGVVVIDVEDPTNPKVVGTYDDSYGPAQRLIKQGKTLFVPNGQSGGMLILDTSNPAHPTLVTYIEVPSYVYSSNVYSVAMYGDKLLVATDDGVYAYRVGGGLVDLATLSNTATYDGYEVWDVKVLGDLAFIAGGPDGFYIIDIHDPYNPVLLDRYPSGGGGQLYTKLDVDGQFAYVCTTTMMIVFDIRDPTNIILTTTLSGAVTDVKVKGGVAYISHIAGFTLVNVTFPTDPELITSQNLGLANVTCIDVQGSYVYLGQNLGGSGPGFYVYDIMDMENPIQTDFINRPSHFYDILIDGDLAYCGNGYQMTVINISNPYLISECPYTSYDSMGVAAFGPYILSAGATDGLALINATNSLDSQVESQYTAASGALQVTIQGDWVYIALSGHAWDCGPVFPKS